MGVELVGRLAAIRDGRALFSGGLRNLFALADLKMERLLDDVRRVGARDRRATARSARPSASSRPACRRRRACRSTSRSGGIRSIVWATGFHPDYRWLHVPVLDEKGAAAPRRRRRRRRPGLYALGLPVLRRRKSTFIHGIEDDARDVVDHLAGYLASPAATIRSSA